MIQVIWEFRVRPDAEEAFERVYAADGDWAELFSRHPGFGGTMLLRDVSTPRRYLTVDSWESKRHRDDMLAASEDEYSRLDAACADWMESEAEVGIFDVPARSSPRSTPAG